MFDRLPERERNVEVFPARAWPTKQSFTEWSGCTPWGRSRVPLMVTGEFYPLLLSENLSLSIVMGNKWEINMESFCFMLCLPRTV